MEDWKLYIFGDESLRKVNGHLLKRIDFNVISDGSSPHLHIAAKRRMLS